MIRISALAALLGILVCAVPAGAEEDGFVTFTESTPYAAYSEIFRRLGTPADLQAVVDGLAAKGQRLAEQPIDPSQEKFYLHVPPEMPAGGYNLLVFVWPWDNVIMPHGWAKILDKHGMIMVSANKSGNEQRIESRRVPLAMIALANVLKRYQINPAHVFIGGLSGGSRTAERLAVGYPDLFQGALLNAGADPLTMLAKPSADLYSRFLEAGHVVFITGDLDASNIVEDSRTMTSMREACMFRFDSYRVPNLPHAVLPAPSLDMALKALLNPPPPDNEKLSKCLSGLSVAGR